MSHNILVVCATAEELSVFTRFSSSVLVSGVGMVTSVFNLTRHLEHNKYDLIINAGIAGSFNKDIPLGEVVQITADTFSELGAEDNDSFIDIFSLGFIKENEYPFSNKEIHSDIVLPNVKTCKGITVNKVHGSAESIQKNRSYFDAEIESMEGAACMYVAKMYHIPVLQIRSVSNYVEPRNRGAWNIPLALNNLTRFFDRHWNDIINQVQH